MRWPVDQGRYHPARAGSGYELRRLSLRAPAISAHASKGGNSAALGCTGHGNATGSSAKPNELYTPSEPVSGLESPRRAGSTQRASGCIVQCTATCSCQNAPAKKNSTAARRSLYNLVRLNWAAWAGRYWGRGTRCFPRIFSALGDQGLGGVVPLKKNDRLIVSFTENGQPPHLLEPIISIRHDDLGLGGAFVYQHSKTDAPISRPPVH